MAGSISLVTASLLLLSMLITGLDAQATNCVWTPYPRTLIYGGTPVSSANTLGACQAACVGSCTGVDWAPNNAAGSQCFLLQKKTDKVSNVDGVDHYDYDCPGSGSGGCSFSQPIPNTNIYGGAANPASTLQGCMSACQLNTSCQGIDWAPGNSAGQQCFLQSTTSGKNSGITGVTHYDYFCNGSGNAGGGTTLPGSLLSSTTIVPTNCWDTYNNTLIYGGTQNPATSLNDCYTACRTLGRPSCLSVDWSRVNAVGSQCFILSTQMGKVQAQGVDHYDLRSNC